MDEKKMTFTVEAPADLPPVDVDSGRLRWAIINLVRNAWQYTPEGGAVTLRLSANDNRLVLDVVDSGAGISAESQSRLFERFYRGEDGAVRGLGLGLYVTKAIVEAHGGEVCFNSQAGKGSTFSIALPMTPASEGK
jgi:signal transduction histidine kinase